MKTSMIRKTGIALLLLLALSPALSGQKFRASFTTGIGTYRMQNMKAYLDLVNESLPFSPEIVDNFPPFLWYSFAATWMLGDFSAGLAVNYNSTGSRVSLKDYSGEYLSDRTLRAVSPGITAGYLLPPLADKLSLTPSLELGMIFSTMEVAETLVVGNELVYDYYSVLGAVNLYAGPSLRVGYSIVPRVSLELLAGYIIQFNGGYFKPKVPDSYTDTYKTKPDWTGLRCGLSVVVAFP